MSTITAQELERDPAGLLRRVEQGESVLVMRGSLAIAEVKPLAKPPAGMRPRGLAAGQLTVPDDFDAPLPAAVLDEFDGSGGTPRTT